MKSRFLLPLVLLSVTAAHAEPLMTKAQYEDYSVRYQCIEMEHVHDLNAKEEALIALEQKYNLSDDTFDAFDELVSEYERDDELLDRIITRVREECRRN